jgi:hypothetical protein
MSTGAWIGLAAGLAAALVGLVIAGLAVGFAVRQERRLRHAQPSVRPGSEGQVVDIPVRQITRLLPGALVAFGRARGIALFRIYPHGIEYRIVRRASVPFAEIEEVDAPFPGRPYFTVRFRGRVAGIGVLAAAEHVVGHAMWRLAGTCRLTDRAKARIRE